MSGIIAPYTLKNCNLYIADGAVTNYAGRVSSIKLPEIKVKLESYRAGGMDFELSFDQGLERLECEFTLIEFSAAVRRSVAIHKDHNTVLIFKGSIGNDTAAGATQPAQAYIRGLIHTDSPSEWSPGKKTEDNYKVEVRTYELKINGKEIYFIDHKLMIRRINGVDYLKSQRSDIGF